LQLQPTLDTGLEEGLACVHLRFGQRVFCTFEGSVGVFTAVVALCNYWVIPVARLIVHSPYVDDLVML